MVVELPDSIVIEPVLWIVPVKVVMPGFCT